MATEPHNATIDKGPQKPAPSPRAMSAREAALQADPTKRTTRVDPAEAQRRAAQAAHEADPEKNPAPQRGLSSSELNSAPPSVKAQASRDAKALPHNNLDPDKGVSERQEQKAQKEQEKETKDEQK